MEMYGILCSAVQISGSMCWSRYKTAITDLEYSFNSAPSTYVHAYETIDLLLEFRLDGTVTSSSSDPQALTLFIEYVLWGGRGEVSVLGF